MDWSDILGAGGVVAMIGGAWAWLKAKAQAKSANDIATSNERKAETIRAERVEVARIEADALVAPALLERIDKLERRTEECEERHRECREETARQSRELAGLSGELAGLRARIAERDEDVTRRVRVAVDEAIHSTPPQPLRTEDVQRAIDEERRGLEGSQGDET